VVAHAQDIFRRYPNQYESIIATLCENLESLDEPEAKVGNARLGACACIFVRACMLSCACVCVRVEGRQAIH